MAEIQQELVEALRTSCPKRLHSATGCALTRSSIAASGTRSRTISQLAANRHTSVRDRHG
jgi:hypothetical protein